MAGYARPRRPTLCQIDLARPPHPHVVSLSRTYVAEYYRFQTYTGVWNGWYANAGSAPNLTPVGLQARTAELERWEARLREASARFGVAEADEGPPTAESLELATLEHARRAGIFRMQTLRRHHTNPSVFATAIDVSVYFNRPFAPPRERLALVTRYLRDLPEMLAGVSALLGGVYGRSLVASAVALYTQLLAYYSGEMRLAGVAMAATSDEREGFLRVAEQATCALAAFLTRIRRLPSCPDGESVLGADQLQSMLATLEGVTTPLDALRAVGATDLRRNAAQARLLSVAADRAPMRAVFAELDTMFPATEEVPDTARRMLAALHRLVAERELFAQAPPLASCQVRATPQYVPAGTAVLEGAGLFDAPDVPAYLYLTLPRANATPAARDARLATLTPWALWNTLAHEVFPGHHLQRWHLARHPSYAVRAFPSYAALEGWAHYAEELVMAGDTGSNEDTRRYTLAHLRMAILRDCRYVIALDLHSGRMSLDDAAAFVTRWTGFSRSRARQEALRALADPGYLVYTLGKLVLRELRDDRAHAHGTEYSLSRFHETLLALGAPPLPLLMRAMSGRSELPLGLS